MNSVLIILCLFSENKDSGRLGSFPFGSGFWVKKFGKIAKREQKNTLVVLMV